MTTYEVRATNQMEVLTGSKGGCRWVRDPRVEFGNRYITMGNQLLFSLLKGQDKPDRDDWMGHSI